MKTLRSDRREEFMSRSFGEYYMEFEIRREFLAPYTPYQNEMVEHKNRTMVEMAQCLLKGCGLLTEFWVEAIATSVYLINRSPTQAVRNKIPYEVWHEEKPNVNHFKIFGCIVLLLFLHKNSKNWMRNLKNVCFWATVLSPRPTGYSTR